VTFSVHKAPPRSTRPRNNTKLNYSYTTSVTLFTLAFISRVSNLTYEDRRIKTGYCVWNVYCRGVFILLPGFVMHGEQEARTQFIATTIVGFKQEGGWVTTGCAERRLHSVMLPNFCFNLAILKFTQHRPNISSPFLRLDSIVHNPTILHLSALMVSL
jgi:hypothetical protein